MSHNSLRWLLAAFLILSAPLESPPGHAARPQDATNFKYGFLYTVLEIDLAPQCPGSKMCSEKRTTRLQECFCKETTSKTGFVQQAGPGGGEATRSRQQSANAKFGIKTRSFDRNQCIGTCVANSSVPAAPAQGRSRWKHRGQHTLPTKQNNENSKNSKFPEPVEYVVPPARHIIPRIPKLIQFRNFRNLLVCHSRCHQQGSCNSLQCVPHIL